METVQDQPQLQKFSELKKSAQLKLRYLSHRLGETLQDHIIGPMEKGMELAKIQTPPEHIVDGIDLRVLPKFICYRAALLREKLSLQYWVAILSGLSLILFVFSRVEISHLYDKLREKPYILAPGVQDFITVAPQSVPDSHVANAAMEFLETFGNINPVNIDEQYSRLEESMSQELKILFEIEAGPWKSKVKSDGISQVFSISEKEIRTKRDGYFEVTAVGRKDSYVNQEHIGSTEEVVEMVLKLIPPRAGKRWYLEIEKLESHEANAFRVKGSLNGSGQTGATPGASLGGSK
jgi:hypothetical protein